VNNKTGQNKTAGTNGDDDGNGDGVNGSGSVIATDAKMRQQELDLLATQIKANNDRLQGGSGDTEVLKQVSEKGGEAIVKNEGNGGDRAASSAEGANGGQQASDKAGNEKAGQVGTDNKVNVADENRNLHRTLKMKVAAAESTYLHVPEDTKSKVDEVLRTSTENSSSNLKVLV